MGTGSESSQWQSPHFGNGTGWPDASARTPSRASGRLLIVSAQFDGFDKQRRWELRTLAISAKKSAENLTRRADEARVRMQAAWLLTPLAGCNLPHDSTK